MKDQATKRPWHLDGFNLTAIIVKENNNYRNLLDCRYYSRISLDEAIANSRLIVKAVNMHDELIESLRNVLAITKETDFPDIINKAEEVLAKCNDFVKEGRSL